MISISKYIFGIWMELIWSWIFALSSKSFIMIIPQVVQFCAMQVAEAVDSLYSEFRAVDNLVAHNTTRVLKAFQNARVGSHVRFCFFVFLFFGGFIWI